MVISVRIRVKCRSVLVLEAAEGSCEIRTNGSHFIPRGNLDRKGNSSDESRAQEMPRDRASALIKLCLKPNQLQDFAVLPAFAFLLFKPIYRQKVLTEMGR